MDIDDLNDFTRANFISRINKISIIDNDDRVNLLVKTGLLPYVFYTEAMNLYKIANEVYPDQCDLQLCDNYDRKNGKYLLEYGLRIIIHFPLLHVSNSDKVDYVITDIFYAINLKMIDNRIKINGTGGIRTSFTYSEVSSKYMFSHLSSTDFSDPPKYLNFCFGDGDLPRIQTRFNQMHNILSENRLAVTRDQTFRIYLMSIEPYLSWESLEGGPYREIKNISDYSVIYNPVISKHYLISDSNSILRNIKELDFDITFNKGIYHVADNSKFEQSIVKFVEKSLSSTRLQLLFKKASNGDLYDVHSSDRRRVLILSDIPIIFKQKEYFYTISDNEESKITDTTLYLNPNLKNYVRTKLEFIINSETFRSNFAERLQTENPLGQECC